MHDLLLRVENPYQLYAVGKILFRSLANVATPDVTRCDLSDQNRRAIDQRSVHISKAIPVVKPTHRGEQHRIRSTRHDQADIETGLPARLGFLDRVQVFGHRFR